MVEDSQAVEIANRKKLKDMKQLGSRRNSKKAKVGLSQTIQGVIGHGRI